MDSYCKLAEAASVGIATSDTPDVAEHLKLGVQSLGGAMVSQLGALGTFLADEDARTKRDLISTTKALKEKVTNSLCSSCFCCWSGSVAAMCTYVVFLFTLL